MIIIGPGITIGGGIGVDGGAGASPGGGGGGTTMRSLLSGAGQTAYDAAVSGDWFEVSSTDYDAVYAGLTGMSKVGMSDAQMNESGTNWSTNYLVTAPQANATVANGSYLLGFRCKFNVAATPSTKIYSSTTYKGTYSQVANTLTVSGSGFKYFLRKTPSAVAANTYIAIFVGTSMPGGTTSWAGSGYSTNFSTWSVWNGTIPLFQSLVTTTQQW